MTLKFCGTMSGKIVSFLLRLPEVMEFNLIKDKGLYEFVYL